MRRGRGRGAGHAGGGWDDAQPHLGGGQWDLAPAGDDFVFGDPEVHQEGMMSTAGKKGSHSAAWKGEMVGVVLRVFSCSRALGLH